MRTAEQSKLLIELGERIRKIRLEKGFNQTEFANIIGKDQPSINRLERGNINVGYLYLLQIAKGLDVNVNELV